MSSRRTLKAASAIREVVSLAILTELRDPRIRNVTVTFVEISGDMRYAKVHVSIMASPKDQELCLHGLRSAAGFLQKRVNDRIDTRYTPRIQFVLDDGVKRSFKVAEILREVLPHDEELGDGDAASYGDTDSYDDEAYDEMQDDGDVDADDDDADDDESDDDEDPDELADAPPDSPSAT